MPIPRPEERLGTVLSERYELDRILGKGGMGVVFAGTHAWTGRPIAVKLLLPQYAEDPDLLRRFFQEARAAAALEHPNVIDVLDLGEDDEGEAFIVLEYLEGEPMSELLHREETIDIETLLPIALPVMDALCEAHAQGIIHRDLKPDNIFISDGVRGRTVPKLLDFGISKLLESQSVSTATGGMLGTPQYMSPEQASGLKDIDGQSDVFSMAVVLYHALSGALPFDAETPMLMMVKVMTATAAPILELVPDLPPSIAAVIDQALANKRETRTASMSAFLTGLVDAAVEVGIPLDDSLLDYRTGAERAPTKRPSKSKETEGRGPSKRPSREKPRTQATVAGQKKKKPEESVFDESPASDATRNLGGQGDVRTPDVPRQTPHDEEAAAEQEEDAVGAAEDRPGIEKTRPLDAAARTSMTSPRPEPPAGPRWTLIVAGAAGLLVLAGVGLWQLGGPPDDGARPPTDDPPTLDSASHLAADDPPIEVAPPDEPEVREPEVGEPAPEPEPRTVERMIISDPLGAQVSIDSEAVGPSPLTVRVPADGSLEVTVSMAGYVSQTLPVSGRVSGPQTVRLVRRRRRSSGRDLAPQ